METLSLVWTMLLAGTALVYAAWVIWTTGGLRRLRPGVSPALRRVSVIVPARNEATHLPATLASLARQEYPAGRWEVVLVNDRSEDGTPAIMRQWASEQPMPVHVVDVEETPEGLAPKKHAVAEGIRRASGEVIVLTDADTLHGPGWVRGLVRHFDHGVGLVAGLALRRRRGGMPLWQRLEAVDFLSLGLMSAGALGRGTAYTCIASNLAFRREAFEAVGGYAGHGALVTGDDDQLMHAIRGETGFTLRYASEPETFIETVSPATPLQMLDQRSRWASGGAHYPPFLLGLLLNAFAFYVLLLAGLPLALAGWVGAPSLLVAAGGLGLKTLADGGILYVGCRRFGLRGYVRHALLAEVLHVPLILAAAVLGHLGTFSWKGATYRRRLEPDAEAQVTGVAEN